MSEPFLGEIRMVGFNFAPTGWAFCAGQIMAIAQNSALFALLGTTFGGNGQVTFGLPDYRGRSPVGMGAGPGLSSIQQGEMSGTEDVTLLSTQMPQHTHTATFAGQPSPVSGTAATTVSVDVGTSAANPMVSPTQGATTYLAATTAKAGLTGVTFNGLYASTPPDATKATLGGINASTAGTGLSCTPVGNMSVGLAGGSLPVPTRNPYLGTNFIIALEGIFPSRP
jgi:microcystin-dependent protein